LFAEVKDNQRYSKIKLSAQREKKQKEKMGVAAAKEEVFFPRTKVRMHWRGWVCEGCEEKTMPSLGAFNEQ